MPSIIQRQPNKLGSKGAKTSLFPKLLGLLCNCRLIFGNVLVSPTPQKLVPGLKPAPNGFQRGLANFSIREMEFQQADIFVILPVTDTVPDTKLCGQLDHARILFDAASLDQSAKTLILV